MAPRYGGVRTWVEGLLVCEDRVFAEASNLMGYVSLIEANLFDANSTPYA